MRDKRQTAILLPMSSRTGLDDTIEMRRAMATHYSQMSPEDKLRRVRDLTIAVSRLAMAGLRARHPDETEGQLLLRLARIRLGDDIVNAAYASNAG